MNPSPHPLSLNLVLLVLEKVFLHLPLEELKKCRLVSKNWCHEATLCVRKSTASIPFGSTASLKKLILISSKSLQTPLTKFNLSSHLFSSPDCESTILQFFKILAPDLESINMTLDKDSECFSTHFENKDCFSFPKLKSITLTGHGLDSSTSTKNGSHVPYVFEIILRGAVKPDNLSFLMDAGCRETVRCLFNLLSLPQIQQNLKSLQSLEIYSPVGDKELEVLSHIPFKLKYLSCDFHRSCFLQKSLKSFLDAQSDSLEYLKFDNYYGTSCYTVEFPVMRNITTLKIDGRSELSSKEVVFSPFSYTENFPSLNKLVLGGSIELNKCWKMIFPEDTRVTSLKYLKLTAQFIDPAWISKIGWLFPNLIKLYFVLSPRNEPLAEMIFKSLTNLQQLIIYIHPSSQNLDHIFTGLEKSECEALNNDPSRSSFHRSPKPQKVPMSNLKNLHTLCIRSENPTGSHISDLTAQLSLLQMPGLKTLKTCPFQISRQTLKTLKQKLDLTLVTQSSSWNDELGVTDPVSSVH